MFLTFEGCPLSDAAMESLECALRACEFDSGGYEVIDIFDPETSDDLTSWGSPTILVNGEDVAGQARGTGAGCRLYDTPDLAPPFETIVAAIRKLSGT